MDALLALARGENGAGGAAAGADSIDELDVEGLLRLTRERTDPTGTESPA
jgi:hypothetical protein